MLFLYGLTPDRFPNRYLLVRAFTTKLVQAACIALICTTTIVAQEGRPVTLSEAEQLALLGEPGRDALLARANAMRAQAAVAAALPQPNLTLGLNNFPFESGGFSTEGMTSVGVNVRQQFPAGQSRSIAARQFELSAMSLSRSASARHRDVITQLRIAWLNRYYWERVYVLVNEQRSFFEDLLKVTRSLYAVGRKSQQELLRAQLELSRLDDRLLEVERERHQATASMALWIGDEALRPVAAALPDWQVIPSLDLLMSNLAQHPAVLASDAQVDAGKAGIDLAEERVKPDWAIDVGYRYREGALESGAARSDFVSVNVTVGLPFFSKRSIDSNLTAALQERSAAKLSRQRVSRELQSELRRQYANFRELGRRIELYEQQIIRQSEAHTQASLRAFQSDEGNFSDVMRAFIDDLDTQTNFVRLQVERAQAYAVLANLGGLEQ